MGNRGIRNKSVMKTKESIIEQGETAIDGFMDDLRNLRLYYEGKIEWEDLKKKLLISYINNQPKLNVNGVCFFIDNNKGNTNRGSNAFAEALVDFDNLFCVLTDGEDEEYPLDEIYDELWDYYHRIKDVPQTAFRIVSSEKYPPK